MKSKQYMTPVIKVVKFQVENGFQNSLTVKSPLGQQNNFNNQPGKIETFGRTTFEGWTETE